MECPKCKRPESDVIDSRNGLYGWRRRRSCPGCGYRWTTYELTKEEIIALADKLTAKQIKRKSLLIVQDAYKKIKNLTLSEDQSAGLKRVSEPPSGHAKEENNDT